MGQEMVVLGQSDVFLTVTSVPLMPHLLNWCVFQKKLVWSEDFRLGQPKMNGNNYKNI